MSESKLKWRERAEQAGMMLQICRTTTECYHGVGETPKELFQEVVDALHKPENRTVRIIDVIDSVVREFRVREAKPESGVRRYALRCPEEK